MHFALLQPNGRCPEMWGVDFRRGGSREEPISCPGGEQRWESPHRLKNIYFAHHHHHQVGLQPINYLAVH